MKKKIKMRRVGILVICLVLMLLITSVATAQEKITLGFQQWFYGDPNVGKIMDWYIGKFEEKYPNVEIKPASITNEMYWDKLAVDIIGNAEDDIVTLDTGSGMYGHYRLRPGGTFISLDDYIEGYILEDGTSLENDIMLMDQMKRDGHYIALPHNWFVATNTAYRKSHLKDAGVSVEDMKTWKGFKEGAEKLTGDLDGDGRIDRYGFGHPVYPEVLSRWWHMHWLWTAGGGIFPNEKPPYTAENLIFNSPENVFAVEYLVDLIKKASPPGNKKLFELYPMFYAGNLSTVHVAIWALSLLEDNMKPEGSYETDLGYFSFPAVNYKGKLRQPVYVTWGNPVAISTRSKHPDMAFKFIAFLHSKEVQRRLSLWTAPVNKMVLSTFYKQDYPKQYEFIEMSNFEYRIVPDVPQWSALDHIIQQAMNTALLGLKSPKEALDWGQTEMIKVLSK